jgi:parallel beta-helix repeat protein
VSNNLGNGIDADASYVSGNTVTGNQGVGISDLVGASTVANNTVSNNGFRWHSR